MSDANEIPQFVISGHKVYTTFHTSSANGVLFRLIALGVRSEELSGPDVVNSVLPEEPRVITGPKVTPGQTDASDVPTGPDKPDDGEGAA